MLILFALMIGAAILFLVWGITAPRPAARANLFAGLETAADDQPEVTLAISQARIE